MPKSPAGCSSADVTALCYKIGADAVRDSGSVGRCAGTGKPENNERAQAGERRAYAYRQPLFAMLSSPFLARELIAVDWGTTNLRAWHIDAQGTVLEARSTDRGIASVSTNNYEDVLRGLLNDWLQVPTPPVVIAFGMITSRNGWIEVPYVACPYDASDLATHAIAHRLSDDTIVYFVPGVRDNAARPYPEVMRGEETQLVGCQLDGVDCVVCPGTHSKWARIEREQVTGFHTALTGELFGVLTTHAFTSRGKGTEDPETFAKAVAHARDRADGLLTGLFSARTGVLADDLATAHVHDYVSGTLIGHEFRDALETGRCRSSDTVLLIGDPAITQRYAIAAETFALNARIESGNAAVRGAWAIAGYLEDAA